MARNCGDRPHRGPRRRGAVPGLRLCSACRRSVRAGLTELPDLYEECETALVRSHGRMLERVSGSGQAPGIRLDDEVIRARSNIVGFLASWSELVADERHVTRPRRRRPTELATFLGIHLDWLLAHHAAADFEEEISTVTRVARRSAYVDPEARMDFGRCVHPGCDAPMSVLPIMGDGRRMRDVRCAAGHVWQPHQWLQLFHQMQQARSAQNTDAHERPEGAA